MQIRFLFLFFFSLNLTSHCTLFLPKQSEVKTNWYINYQVDFFIIFESHVAICNRCLGSQVKGAHVQRAAEGSGWPRCTGSCCGSARQGQVNRSASKTMSQVGPMLMVIVAFTLIVGPLPRQLHVCFFQLFSSSLYHRYFISLYKNSQIIIVIKV